MAIVGTCWGSWCVLRLCSTSACQGRDIVCIYVGLSRISCGSNFSQLVDGPIYCGTSCGASVMQAHQPSIGSHCWRGQREDVQWCGWSSVVFNVEYIPKRGTLPLQNEDAALLVDKDRVHQDRIRCKRLFLEQDMLGLDSGSGESPSQCPDLECLVPGLVVGNDSIASFGIPHQTGTKSGIPVRWTTLAPPPTPYVPVFGHGLGREAGPHSTDQTTNGCGWWWIQRSPNHVEWRVSRTLACYPWYAPLTNRTRHLASVDFSKESTRDGKRKGSRYYNIPNGVRT